MNDFTFSPPAKVSAQVPDREVRRIRRIEREYHRLGHAEFMRRSDRLRAQRISRVSVAQATASDGGSAEAGAGDHDGDDDDSPSANDDDDEGEHASGLTALPTFTSDAVASVLRRSQFSVRGAA